MSNEEVVTVKHVADLVTTDLVAGMKLDVAVGLNDVVAVFVAKYEDNLFTEKATLSAKVRDLKAKLKELDGEIVGTIDRAKYEGTLPHLDLVVSVTDVTVGWTQYNYGKPPTHSIVVHQQIVMGDDTHHKNVSIDIDSHFVDAHKGLEADLQAVTAELTDIVLKISSVGRKERQVRGRLSEMKLEASGFSNVLADPEMMKLVQIK